MQDSKYLIFGIDPDLEKSGIARLDKNTNRIEMTCLDFIHTLNYIRENKEVIKCVYIEAGWFNRKSNWHGAETLRKSASIGRNVGENHATGKLLAQCIEYEQVKVVLVRPTQKKLNAEQFKKMTGIQTRTNQEVRDAAMLVFGR